MADQLLRAERLTLTAYACTKTNRYDPLSLLVPGTTPKTNS